MEKKERQIGLDIIRALALLLVFITHGIQYKDVLAQDVTSFHWGAWLYIRFIALSCVPLFIILTGFLNNHTEINWKYYRKIIPLFLSYFLISFIELFGNNMYEITDGVLRFTTEKISQINFPVEIVRIFNFTENSYAWYFEMYIGLFILIPFLNILWNNLKNKKERVVLLSTVAFLSLIPKVIESFRFEWLNASDLAGWLDILPDYWKIVHPLAYFFIGKYIREYRPNPNVLIKIGAFILASLVPTVICYFVSQHNEAYAWYICNGFGTITNAFVATTIFIMFYTVKAKIPVLSQIITQISICSFEMYLFSSIFDKLYYYLFADAARLETMMATNIFEKIYKGIYACAVGGAGIFVIAGLVLISTYIVSRIWITVRDLLFKKLLKVY